MTFALYKTVSFLLLPSSVVALLVLAGAGLLVANRAKALAKRMIAAAAVLLVLLGYGPVSFWLMAPLEQRFQRPQLPGDVAGIIMLGGFEITRMTRARGALQINEAAERLTEASTLARRLPGARVIFAGGDSKWLLQDGSAASAISRYLSDIGVDPARHVLERGSRTTHENAVELRRMLQPTAGQIYILVTSAYHMPRAVGTFRLQGFDVVPWPVDYRSRGWQDALVFGANTAAEGLARADVAVKEWIGLAIYRLLGRTNALWPGPSH